MNAIIVLDTGCIGDNPMGGGQYARIELIRLLKEKIPAYYCLITYRENMLSELAKDIYDEVKITDYVFIRQRRHEVSLTPANLFKILISLVKGAYRVGCEIKSIQNKLHADGILVIPNENYSRVVFSVVQLLRGNRYKSLMVVDGEFDLAKIDSLFVWLYGLTFSKIMAASRTVAKPFMKIAAKKTMVVYPGVDIDLIRQRTDMTNWKEPRKLKTKINILFSGMLQDFKQPDLAIQAFAKFLERFHRKGTLDICGDGPMLTRLKDLAKKLQLIEGKEINFWGHLERDDYLEKLAEADILIHPSITESFSRVVVEAQAVGVPVIVSDAGVMAEVVVDNETGFIVPTNQVDGFVEKMLVLSEDRHLYSVMSKNAYFFAERFDVNKALSVYANVVNELLGP